MNHLGHLEPEIPGVNNEKYKSTISRIQLSELSIEVNSSSTSKEVQKDYTEIINAGIEPAIFISTFVLVMVHHEATRVPVRIHLLVRKRNLYWNIINELRLFIMAHVILNPYLWLRFRYLDSGTSYWQNYDTYYATLSTIVDCKCLLQFCC